MPLTKVFGHFCVRRKAANFCHPGLDHSPAGIRGFGMNSNDPVSPACMMGHSAERPFAIYPSWSDMSRCQLWWCSRTQRTLSMGGKNDLDLMGTLLIRWIAPELEHNGNGRGAGWLEAHYRRRKRPRLQALVVQPLAKTGKYVLQLLRPLHTAKKSSTISHLIAGPVFPAAGTKNEQRGLHPIVKTPNPVSFSALPPLYI